MADHEEGAGGGHPARSPDLIPVGRRIEADMRVTRSRARNPPRAGSFQDIRNMFEGMDAALRTDSQAPREPNQLVMDSEEENLDMVGAYGEEVNIPSQNANASGGRSGGSHICC